MRILFFLILIAVCKWLAIIFEWTLMEVVFRTLIVLLVISGCFAISLWFGMKISVDCEQENVIKGSKIPVIIWINNKSLTPVSMIRIYITSENELHGISTKCQMSFPVRKWGEQKFIVNMIAGSCGTLNIKVNRFVTKDMIGLFKIRKKVNESYKVVVIPEYNMVSIDEPIINNNVFIDCDTYSKEKPGDDPSEVFDIRQMKDGDQIRRINWKMTLRKNEFMVNDFSLPIGKSTVVLMDMCINVDKKNVTRAADLVFEKFLQISLGLLEYEVTHKVVWFNSKTGFCEEREITPEENVTEIFLKVYECGTYTGESKLLEMYNNQFEMGKVSHLYYICNDITTSTAYQLAESKENVIKKACLVNQLNPTDKNEEVEKLCDALGIEIMIM